jgi:hypothetical protein
VITSTYYCGQDTHPQCTGHKRTREAKPLGLICQTTTSRHPPNTGNQPSRHSRPPTLHQYNIFQNPAIHSRSGTAIGIYTQLQPHILIHSQHNLIPGNLQTCHNHPAQYRNPNPQHIHANQHDTSHKSRKGTSSKYTTRQADPHWRRLERHTNATRQAESHWETNSTCPIN